MQIVEIFKSHENLIGTELEVSGWVKTCRDQKEMIFIHLSDGTTQKTLQVIINSNELQDKCQGITTGTSLSIKGTLVKSPAKGQLFELIANDVIVGQICPHSFPFQKIGLTYDFMRNYPHLRHRSNAMRAVFVVKSLIMKSMHEYFSNKNFCYVDLPILTTNACEGGCQPLQVTALIDSGDTSDIPVISKDDIHNNGVITSIKTTEIDFKKDFFGNKVYLTVSNQLHLECFAHGLGYVYTITPATRGEPSQSTKHLAYFNMLEAEFCFGNLSDNIDMAENCIKYCVQQVMTKCPDELAVLSMASDKKLINKLEKISSEPFIRITHFDAIKLLKDNHQVEKFTDIPDYAGDLSGEHERFLVRYFGKPVIVMKYPKNVKAFYMPVCSVIEIDGDMIEYVDCFDLLMDIGEVVGGSQRISDETELIKRMNELSIDPKHLDWYISLRRFGTIAHGGFGIGIERLVAVIAGMTNVKDCISFPITVHHCTY